jgi:hypothetical protein
MVQKITFGHTCRLAGHEQATLLVCFFGHTCSSKWSFYQNHGRYLVPVASDQIQMLQKSIFSTIAVPVGEYTYYGCIVLVFL